MGGHSPHRRHHPGPGAPTINPLAFTSCLCLLWGRGCRGALVVGALGILVLRSRGVLVLGHWCWDTAWVPHSGGVSAGTGVPPVAHTWGDTGASCVPAHACAASGARCL